MVTVAGDDHLLVLSGLCKSEGPVGMPSTSVSWFWCPDQGSAWRGSWDGQDQDGHPVANVTSPLFKTLPQGAACAHPSHSSVAPATACLGLSSVSLMAPEPWTKHLIT
jgi:hypothetical protein